jgi:HAD superfamily hydrolase (TIGR01509 family)
MGSKDQALKILREEHVVKQFAGIIFDMDGLLIDSERVALATFQQVCDLLSLGDQSALFLQCVGTNKRRGEEILAAGFAGQVDLHVFTARWDELHDAHTQNNAIPIKAGAVSLLATIRSHGIPMAVATSTETERALHKLRCADIEHYFDHVVGGNQVHRSKPEPDIYLRAAELLAISPASALALEDSENGVLAALAAGMTVVQVPDLVQPSAAFRAKGQHVIRSLNDVANYDFEYPKEQQL